MIALLDKRVAEKTARFFDIFKKNGVSKYNVLCCLDSGSSPE